MKYLTLSVVSGLLFSLAFEPYSIWILAPISWVIFLVSLRQVAASQKFLLGFVFALAFWLVQINWLTVIGLPVLVITAVGLSVFYGAFALACRFFDRTKLWPIGYAMNFLLLEVILTYWPLGGFNWGSAGYISASHPLVYLAQLVGAFGLAVLMFSLVIVLIYAFELIRVGGFIAALALIVLWGGFIGVLTLVNENQNEPSTPSEVDIAVVQGNVPRLGLAFNEQRKAVYQNHINETLKLINDNPNQKIDLVVWPENAPDVDPFENIEISTELNSLSKMAKAPILVGSRMQSEQGAINASILFTGNTTKSDAFIYAKQKLVPFGEKIPLEEVLGPLASNFGPISQSLMAGTKPGVLKVSGANIGLMICFEVAWGQIAKQVVERGANVLLIQTNNATYGLTNQLPQQFNIAKLRAIESQKQVLTVATSGISGQIDKNGDVLWIEDEFVAASEILSVSLYEGMNVGVLLNIYLQYLIVILWIIMVLFVIISARIRNHDR